MISLPPAELLRDTFSYDPESGYLTWKERTPKTRGDKIFNAKYVGTRVGSINTWGHRQVKFSKVTYVAHRIIWKIMTGEDPADQVDHIDGDYDNNAWANLRPSTGQTNMWNVPVKRNSTIGLKGVQRVKRSVTNPFKATIMVDGKRVYLGVFPTAEAAHAAYNEAFVKHRAAEWFRR